ncbi:MAG TPA: 4Fe-4S binding protein, partial [Chthoniobacterales bacterium]|nr:4Fe-4S binding protein [Chthoniobacterales bacterium]
GTFPTGTSRFEKRNLAQEVPVWEEDLCIQCGKCVLVCPHAVIRSKVYDPGALQDAPVTFKSREARLPEWKGLNYTLQVAVEDCTGCGICVDVCPVRSKSEARRKAINMHPQLELRETERKNWDFFLSIPDRERRQLSFSNVREMQVAQPLFEFSGACAGCGETPYIKLLTQLFGDRLLIANATGCSSIYGGNLPTAPYTAGSDGCGPAWSNSLFEDAAEFGLGFRVSLDKQREYAEELLRKLTGQVSECIANEILAADQHDAAGVYAQRRRVAELKRELQRLQNDDAMRLLPLADTLARKSVWIVGGDGWGYDIGYGGLDHVLASGRNVKVLLLDTEVYSNTGGQCSKSTPLGAVAKFASAGKRTPKKDLGLIAMTYGNIYVASVAMGAKDEHTLKSFLEAEAYDGPALIIAYSHCIAHGINMTTAMNNQRTAVLSGQWLLYRYNPAQALNGGTPLHVDSAPPKVPVAEYFNLENRFKMLSKSRPADAKRLFQEAQDLVDKRWQFYQRLSKAESTNKESGPV